MRLPHSLFRLFYYSDIFQEALYLPVPLCDIIGIIILDRQADEEYPHRLHNRI